MEEGKNFDYRVIELKRVAKVTEGGKRIRVRAVVVVGNYQGEVGCGIAKGLDAADAVMKARRLGEKNALKVPIVNGTVPYEVKAKFGSAKILIKPTKQGRGIIAGGSARIVLTLAGYTDVVAKILGVTKNPLVNTLVTLKALEKFKNYEKKLVLKERLFSKKQNANSSNQLQVEEK